MKDSKFHYELFATDPIIESSNPEEIAKMYVFNLEVMLKKYPEQWFNFYDFYAGN